MAASNFCTVLCFTVGGTIADPDACFFPSTAGFFIVGAVVGTLIDVGLGEGVGVGVFLTLGAMGSILVEGSEGAANDCDVCSFARRFSLI